MNSKDKIIAIIFTILVSIICLIPIYDFKIYAKETPKSLFKVYLNGKSIGVIESKEKLENYINNEQKDLKEKCNVDTVYAPAGLYIVPYTTYNDSCPIQIGNWTLSTTIGNNIKVFKRVS